MLEEEEGVAGQELAGDEAGRVWRREVVPCAFLPGEEGRFSCRNEGVMAEEAVSDPEPAG